MGRPNETILFSLIQLIYWSANCVLYAFMVMFLKANGFSDSVCGIVSALLSGMSIIIQPLMGYISDTYITGKKLLLGCFAVAIPFTMVLPYTVSLGVIFIGAVTVLSFFDNYQFAIIDAWVIKLKPICPDLDFTRIRSFGSLGYGITALIFGNLIAKFGFNIMFYTHSLLLLLVVLLMLPLPEAPCLNKTEHGKSNKLSFLDVTKLLIANKRYVILIISVCVYQFANRAPITFLALLIKAAGGDSADLGMATFASAGFEFPVMIVLSTFIKKGAKMPYLFATAMLINVSRLFILSMRLEISTIITLQVIGAVAMGIYITVFTQYIGSITPHSITATATTIGTALTMGVGGVIGNISGGFIIENLGISNYLKVSTFFMLLAFLIFLPNVFHAYKEAKAAKS